jgi:DNA-directed RNA polymerase subunit RPC12/RpoP
MALRVEFTCPHCNTRLNCELTESQEWVCPACNGKVSLSQCDPDADTFRVYDGEPPPVCSSPRNYQDLDSPVEP